MKRMENGLKKQKPAVLKLLKEWWLYCMVLTMVGNLTKMGKKVNTIKNIQYVVAIVIMAVIGVIANMFVAILRPGADSILVIGAVFAFLTPTTLSLLAFLKAQETHLSVNSRLEEFIQTARGESRKQGLIEGKMMGQKEANRRTDEIRKRD